jgi:deoxyribonuclease-4
VTAPVRIGAHVPSIHPLEEAAAVGADVVQVFLSNPKSWKKPPARADAGELRSAGLPIYVHAPYLINVASPNNRVRIPSRTILADTLEAAAGVGAVAVVVHGGHLGDDEDPAVGVERWRKALEAVERPVPILLENTAGGGNAVLRDLSRLGPLWEAIGHLGVGVCLDTCHAWAAGEDLETAVGRVRAVTGGIDLLHCNDSRDPAGSSRDRHANLGRGFIPPALLAGVAAAAGAPIVVETPDDDGGQAADITWLRQRLGGA